ncbi:MAG TPA: CDP-alcohol phosphatidyltransferase family protein [Candidatus Gastranaerophilales bacterium]|nr:CDP-alcohol phosphatidyltransferase family protein [Candidatus Gastranaerophilales bacterium]
MANFISIFRVVLCFIAAGILFIKDDAVYLSAFILTILVIWMDGLDGYVARKFNETSKFGAMLDILSDRIVENVYWVTFAVIGWLPLWIPLAVLTRGLVTDGLRSMALEQGYTAFGTTTMMQSKIGKFIVASNFSRFSYAVFKAIAFALLILSQMPSDYALKPLISTIAYASVYISVFFCIARGIPVIIESKRFFVKN